MPVVAITAKVENPYSMAVKEVEISTISMILKGLYFKNLKRKKRSKYCATRGQNIGPESDPFGERGCHFRKRLCHSNI
jgi:hypothetical protein